MKHVRDERILEAIASWRGNVTAAAADLAMAPKNLRARLAELRVDLAALRSAPTVPPPPERTGTFRAVPSVPVSTVAKESTAGPEQSGTHGGKVGAGTVNTAGASPRFPRVQAAAPKDSAVELPPMTKPRPRPPIRVHPEDQDRLRSARLDLIGRHRVEIDETDILRDFFRTKFAEYLAARLGPEDPQPGPKRRGSKGGQE